MQIKQPLTVSELVRADYRLADVFKKWGINYCCGGNLPLSEVCRLQDLDIRKVETAMHSAKQTQGLSRALAFDEWPVDFLVEYIINIHHVYIKTTGPKLLQVFETFVKGHEKKYPYLQEVYGLFQRLLASTTEQLKYEEDVLFPYIKQVNNALKRKESYGPIFVRTMHKSMVETTMETTKKEQQQTLFLLTSLRDVTKQYQFAKDACTNHQVIYHKLKEYDADLVQHKHLEQNILFPKLLQMENELLQA
jgi:regulator of cell morphogenesis and NO signaling